MLVARGSVPAAPLVATLALVLVLPGAARARPSLARGRSNLPRACFRRSSEPATAACLRPAFRRAVATGRVAATLDELEASVRAGRLDDCHALAHGLGHIAFRRLRLLDRALAAGGAQCSGGYLHGVVEAGVGGPGATSAALYRGDVRVCTRRREPELRDACVHALGHAFMYSTGDNLPLSLSLCRQRLRMSNDRSRCSDGALMENSMRFMRLGAGAFARRAPHACDGVRLRGHLREECYAEIGEVAMFVFRHELRAARRVCARVPIRFGRRACLHGALDEAHNVVGPAR